MADNVAITAGSGTTISTDDAGAGGHVQIIKLAISTDGSATVIPADAANGLDVDVTRLPALPAGTNNIGDVDVVTLPALPAGSNSIGSVTAVAQQSSTSAVTNVASNASSVTLKASNANRKALYICNAGTTNLIVKLGATVNILNSFTAIVPPGGLYELPDDPIYTGVVDGAWASPVGGLGALITELT